jgi:prophage antirepressor-like protein
MEIVKAFNNTNIVIKGTYENPLFRASDIGEILEMTNISVSIKDFNDTEREDVSTTYTLGGNQQTTFLTEKGLYKVLFKSRKPTFSGKANKYNNILILIFKY